MISIIIPARNASETIDRTLSSLTPDKSVIEEILLIDDGSNDNTEGVARSSAEICDLPLIVTRVCFGSAGAARNAGLERARGTYVFFLDADDEIYPGSLGKLQAALMREPKAGLVVGAFLRNEPAGVQNLKAPGRFGADRSANAARYLRNQISTIAIGCGLVDLALVRDLRFPTSVVLDEDTCYWASVLTRCGVVTVDDPVLIYNVNLHRMVDRFATNSRSMFLKVCLEFQKLRALGVDHASLQWRKAWLGRRMARMLYRRGRYSEADRMMRLARAHPDLRWSLRSLRYRVAIAAGKALATGSAAEGRQGFRRGLWRKA